MNLIAFFLNLLYLFCFIFISFCLNDDLRLVFDFLHCSRFTLLRWPPCSPDLNPIEHEWAVGIHSQGIGPRKPADAWPACFSCPRNLGGSGASPGHHPKIRGFNAGSPPGCDWCGGWLHQILGGQSAHQNHTAENFTAPTNCCEQSG